MKVADVLRSKGTTVLTIHSDAPLTAAVAIMDTQNVGALVVLNREEQVVGILAERDVVHALAVHGHAFLARHVRDVMNPHLCICSPQDQLKQAVSCMIEHRMRHLPVMHEGELVGIVSMTDVVQQRFAEVEAEANVLRDIILATH